MKKLILTISFALFAVFAFSQSVNDYLEIQRGVLKTEKKAIVAEAMQLTDIESKTFWPLYNEYSEKLYILDTKVYNLILKYSNDFEGLTNEQAIELWKENMKIKREMAKLETTYFKKFQKILTGNKLLRYFQLENKIETLVAAEMALEIPLAE
jgi:hypothetical protein